MSQAVRPRLTTATLLLTDVESSCRRWEVDPATMRRALACAAHNTIARTRMRFIGMGT